MHVNAPMLSVPWSPTRLKSIDMVNQTMPLLPSKAPYLCTTVLHELVWHVYLASSASYSVFFSDLYHLQRSRKKTKMRLYCWKKIAWEICDECAKFHIIGLIVFSGMHGFIVLKRPWEGWHSCMRLSRYFHIESLSSWCCSFSEWSLRTNH